MQINRIEGPSQQYFSRKVDTTPLDEGQKADLQEILSHYSSENFSDSDKVSLREEMQAAEIPLARETFQTMYEAGFTKPEGVSQMGGMSGRTAAKAEGIDIAPLRELLQQLSSGEINGDEFATQFEELRDQLSTLVGSLVNTSA